MEPTQGKRIKALLKQQGIALGDVAKKIGYTREHFSRLLGGDSVDELLVWKISNAVGVDLAKVLEPKPDECQERVAMLERELEEARQAIKDLTRAIGLLSKQN